jgi:ribonucleotide reductase class II
MSQKLQHQLPTVFEQYIHISRYSRWLEDQKRRESWEETVDRYVAFFDNKFEGKYKDILYNTIKPAILNCEVMPSMRCMMTAGPALLRENIAGYNCSYLAVNTKRSFAEAMYILLCGTGVGFSCERQEVSHLPPVPEELKLTDDTIVVEDSKMGWAKAFNKLLSALWVGDIPQIDYSKIRPAGARLKIFGGRASGPEPLRSLFDYSVHTFCNAQGRKLQSIEVHDLMCKIGEIVVVGGVRRSALISLSNLSDQRMRDAKSGQWWVDHPERALANNSVSYNERPSMEIFMEEWLSLVKSKSGERGIFNRVAAQKQAAKWGRASTFAYGCNPCLTGDTLLLTDFGLRPLHELARYENSFNILNADGEWSESNVVPTGTKPVKKIVLSNGLEFKATHDHLVEIMTKKYPYSTDYIKNETVSVGDLSVGMKMRTLTPKAEWSGYEVFTGIEQAVFAGLMHGDGYNNHDRLSIMNNEPEIVEFINSMFPNLEWDDRGVVRLPSGVMEDLIGRGLNFDHLPERNLPNDFFGWSSLTTKAFLRGLYSANGSSIKGRNRIALKSTCKQMIKDIQHVLLAMGFAAYITTNKPSKILWGNGEYLSKESYDLNICGAEECTRFQKEIGFLHNHKMLPLPNTPRRNQTRVATIVSIDDLPAEPVFDFVEPKTSWAWVNGLKIHNCSEIILRDKEFCNLSEIVAREDDDFKSLKRKVEIATIIGTFQSTLSDFKFLSETWKKNTEEERLLGVSITGIMDNHILSGSGDRDTLKKWLNELRDYSITVNKDWSERLGIPASASITAVKPSGTVSSLVNSASGIHTRHSEYYLRTVRTDKKDPLYQMLKDMGVYVEDDVMKPDSGAVFTFAIKAPEGCLTRDSLTAIEQLDIWMLYQREWCMHKPSVTITVKDHEWMDTGAWVWKNFDEVSGVSFLPHSNTTYRQAPYQAITKAEYEDWLNKHPMPVIDWADLANYEKEDTTTSSQELACSSGVCDIL